MLGNVTEFLNLALLSFANFNLQVNSNQYTKECLQGSNKWQLKISAKKDSN
jgi:hypothetical protein